MASTFTTNKVLEKPGNGDYVDTWNVPVNADLDVIDQAFGGVTSLNATAGSATLTSTQYRSLILSISGAMSANVTYTIPSGVGGQWIVRNTTTDGTGGPWIVTIASAGGGTSVVLDRNVFTIIFSDGTNILRASTSATGVTSFSAGSTGFTPSTSTTGAVTLAGTLAATNGGTGLTSPGASGNILTSNGSAWTSAAPAAATVINVQTFNASGTWTKPAGFSASSRVQIQAWGAGASGVRTNGYLANGGGGGAYAERWLSLSALGATETITVGTGGVGLSSGTGGNDGGNTTVGSLLTAYGGSKDGGGGGQISKGSGGAPGAPWNAIGGWDGSGSTMGQGGYNSPGKDHFWGGAGGGSGSIVTNGNGSNGGTSYLGGGGGGGAASGTGTVEGSGGSGLAGGGNGGVGSKSGTAGSGTQPGGGGGGTSTGTAGNGGDGRVIITIFPA